jgi:peroxiredoxin Q/BCP
MTPGCTQEACDFRDSFARIKKSDAVVLGVSKDSVASHQKFKAKHDLPFTLLSDPEGKVCELYGVWQEKSLYGKKFMGIVRSTFVIDEKGKILRSFAKVKVNGHVDEILDVLKS